MSHASGSLLTDIGVDDGIGSRFGLVSLLGNAHIAPLGSSALPISFLVDLNYRS